MDKRKQRQKKNQNGKKVNLFAKVALRREAQALQNATSFTEFKRILLRASTKAPALSEELGGGVIFHQSFISTKATVPSSSSSRTGDNRKRGISKRSLEEMNNAQTSSQIFSSTLPDVDTSEVTPTEEETEERKSLEVTQAGLKYSRTTSAPTTATTYF